MSNVIFNVDLDNLKLGQLIEPIRKGVMILEVDSDSKYVLFAVVNMMGSRTNILSDIVYKLSADEFEELLKRMGVFEMTPDPFNWNRTTAQNAIKESLAKNSGALNISTQAPF